MTDFLLLKQLQQMVKGVLKPRLAFKKGVSAKGFFRPYMSFADYTEAEMFSSYDEITQVTVRFSAMLGDKGTADTVRNIKGMDVRFYSRGSRYDMMCRNMPVFFINEREKLTKLVNAFTVHEYFDGINSSGLWQFAVENPEAMNCIIRLYSGMGLSDSYIFESWYSSGSTVWENSGGERFLVRYMWKPLCADDERRKAERPDRSSAEFLAGFDADRAADRLCAAIADGRFPQYELYIQMEKYGASSDAGYTSATLIWDEKRNPFVAAGMMKLTEIPEDYRNECELLSFAPGNTVKGIEMHRSELWEVIDYIYQCEAIERGGWY